MTKDEIIQTLEKHLKDGIDYDVLFTATPMGTSDLDKEKVLQAILNPAEISDKIKKFLEENSVISFSDGFILFSFLQMIFHLLQSGVPAESLNMILSVADNILKKASAADLKDLFKVLTSAN